MAFNARWAFQTLADEIGQPTQVVLRQLLDDFGDLACSCSAFKLSVTPNGNYFRLLNSSGSEQRPDPVAGLYAMFTADFVVYFVYFGEASDLRRRQIDDPDNTADSGKEFTNQGRAVLKFLLHNRWTADVRLAPVYIQVYSSTAPLHGRQCTFE